MKLNERQNEIVRLLQRLKQLDVNDLAARFKTSAVTIRKDLDLLQQRGILERTHGGAILAENVQQTISVDDRLNQMMEAKQAVAHSAFNLVFDCKTLALDAGSTTLALARLLKESDLCIVTNSLLIAQELAGRESGSMVLLGGIWRKESSCFIGPDALLMLDHVNIDIAFIGAGGFSIENGFMCQNRLEAQVKERMLSRAERKFIIADSSKYQKRAFTTFAHFKDVDGLIVDNDFPEDIHAELSEQGLHLITPKVRVYASAGGNS